MALGRGFRTNGPAWPAPDASLFGGVGRPCHSRSVPNIRTEHVPSHLDGPALVAAASGLMLIPQNASRLVRLRRLAALGMALPDQGASPASPSAVRSLLKRDDIGGEAILAYEDPYSEVLVQSISFFGGDYLVSPGDGQHTVADLENLLDAMFREPWMPDEMSGPARQLVRALLTISDLVLHRAGLKRGTPPSGSPRTRVDVPGAKGLSDLVGATFIANDEIDRYGDWLRMVIDTFAADPGDLVDPCPDDIADDRLYVNPFLRLPGGYRLILPLDLAITIRFHILRFARQSGRLEELGRRWRSSVLRRFQRLLPPGTVLAPIEETAAASRYLAEIDSKRHLHVVLATDTLFGWGGEVWGTYDTGQALTQISAFVGPNARAQYSTAEELVHLILVDSPGRAAFWGVPNVDGSDPMLIARADDIEVMLHQEQDGLLGLLLFAQAVERRHGQSISTDILDEFCTYVENEMSFYLSDDGLQDFIAFQPGAGLDLRLKQYSETDRHGVVAPVASRAIVHASRRYPRDAPGIFIIEPSSSYRGYVVELGGQHVFVTADLPPREVASVGLNLLEAVAFWVWECASRLGVTPTRPVTEIELHFGDPRAWSKARDWSTNEPAVRAALASAGFRLEFSEAFVGLLQERANTAERELVRVLLATLFEVGNAALTGFVDEVAPSGPKRMLYVFSQHDSPDMLAEGLPRPLTVHEQATAQLLDELGEWLRSPSGGGFPAGVPQPDDRVALLNAAVEHLFCLLEQEVAKYSSRQLIDFLVAQNEALVHDLKFNELMLRSRLACFGEKSDTVDDLVQERASTSHAHRANRFLIEYVAAQPPTGERLMEDLDCIRLLAIANEIVERGTTSDYLKYRLADFEVSILGSGRLGVSREEPVIQAMNAYANHAGMRSVRKSQEEDSGDSPAGLDLDAFITESDDAMRAEFGFTLTDLREVCGGLLDLATADHVTRISRDEAQSKIVAARRLATDVVAAVLDEITLTGRDSFLSIGPDAYPWRFSRNMSYLRRPVVLQGDELVFGFRSIYRLGHYWLESMLSGRLQSRAKTSEMKQFISDVRGKANRSFAGSVAARLQGFGMATRLSVHKIGQQRLVDAQGQDLGDIDVLAVHRPTRSLVAVEAKDFEVARTPAEIAGELEKLFTGKKAKKSTVLLHSRRLEWLRGHIHEVVRSLGEDSDDGEWHVVGIIVTSDPLVTPLIASSPITVIPFADLKIETLQLQPAARGRSATRKRRSKG